MKLAKYGYQFARAFDALLSDGRISEVNLYRSNRLKPKYQRPYFAYAKSISDAELRELKMNEAAPKCSVLSTRAGFTRSQLHLGI